MIIMVLTSGAQIAGRSSYLNNGQIWVWAACQPAVATLLKSLYLQDFGPDLCVRLSPRHPLYIGKLKSQRCHEGRNKHRFNGRRCCDARSFGRILTSRFWVSSIHGVVWISFFNDSAKKCLEVCFDFFKVRTYRILKIFMTSLAQSFGQVSHQLVC